MTKQECGWIWSFVDIGAWRPGPPGSHFQIIVPRAFVWHVRSHTSAHTQNLSVHAICCTCENSYSAEKRLKNSFFNPSFMFTSTRDVPDTTLPNTAFNRIVIYIYIYIINFEKSSKKLWYFVVMVDQFSGLDTQAIRKRKIVHTGVSFCSRKGLSSSWAGQLES